MSIEVENLVSGYWRDIDIIRNISLCAPVSKITGIIGPNGAGKSTLLKTIYGFLKPRKGVIYFKKEDITGVEPNLLLLKGISYIPQLRSIFPFLNVQENLEMGTWTFRKDRKRVKDAIKDVYDRFPVLEEKKKVQARFLSGGQQRMLEISRALMSHPKAILIDEPTAGLAPKPAAMIYNILKNLKEEKLSILFVDQNVREAVRLSDYIYILKMGEIALKSTKDEFRDKMEATIREWLM